MAILVVLVSLVLCAVSSFKLCPIIIRNNFKLNNQMTIGLNVDNPRKSNIDINEFSSFVKIILEAYSLTEAFKELNQMWRTW